MLSPAFLLIIVIAIIPIILFFFFFIYDKNQRQHSILRNYPILGRVRYLLEHTGPEFRQYLFDGDTQGKPFSRNDFLSIIFPSKYLETIISFGSKKDFEQKGYFLKNALFPKLMKEIKVNNQHEIESKYYKTKEETLFKRKETFNNKKVKPWLLHDDNIVIIGGKTCEYPFHVKGLVGMSGMSYGSLGEHSIETLSKGLGMSGGTWMNTGEGGVSDYHLTGDVDIIMQIGPAKFGVRTDQGKLDWEELKLKGSIQQIKAFELKLGQGAKIRGGHLPAEKNTPTIAKARKIKPYVTVESPNSFEEFRDLPSLFDFVDKIRETTGKPVGIKMVVGDDTELHTFAKYMKGTGRGPDFITVDGGEGGSGATYQEMADSMGLPIKSSLMITHSVLKHYGVRDRVKIIASGKLFTADKIAIALSMGADLISMARAYMIVIGCIGAQHCHKNTCPVGVATTNPKLQKALVIEDKKYRVANFTITLRQGLYTLAAAAGLDCPTKFNSNHVVYKDDLGRVTRLKDIEKEINHKVSSFHHDEAAYENDKKISG
ncbi:FMN-binding glutamate synthase family protein [Chengkuizengella axinellae]|uniref:FMN-binding glutamate synthase family protein n=1 Tax=Chengkuizengella axinellae TaxID=3064388 RepID=A0ABT9IZQ1_9BACL|nr:FMN-binding glutamate synthase family protein [Chengkuizengella sp. 2205SS18-9]MDP5274622.1 FMN-binding glutamate synthase family protein [Chengkuizengella sp. 2205SS18-9]